MGDEHHAYASVDGPLYPSTRIESPTDHNVKKPCVSKKAGRLP